jgi:serine/threonine-protein kinase
LLDEALDLPAQDRAVWLANLPQEHGRLRTALGSLLANASPLNSYEAVECFPADAIGAWRLIEKIGEGGMAEVWIAERSDGLLARPVALKLPRGGWGNRLFCERLAREREILDSLHHPNIARLLDAGAASATGSRSSPVRCCC